MRQTFPLTHARHKPPQALSLLKGRLNKYIKRERRKPLADGVDYWDFQCRFGIEEADAEPCHVAELNGLLDGAFEQGAPSVYVEILAKPGVRSKKPDNVKRAEAASRADDSDRG